MRIHTGCMRRLNKLTFIFFLVLSGCTIVGTENDPPPEQRNQMIRSVVIDHKKEILGCYDYELKKDAKMAAGKVTMKWEIDGDGHPQKIGIDEPKSTLKVETLNKCLIDVFTELNFPPPSKGTDIRVTYPLVFNNDGAK
jgi:hypothetical protein